MAPIGTPGGIHEITFSCFLAFWPQGVPKIGPRGAQGVPRATPRSDFESFWLEIWSMLVDFGTISHLPGTVAGRPKASG